ncbi:MAG: helix-turn-helix transcriptional regulator [Quadrisphaera sp.]
MLRGWSARRKKTQAELADALGVSQTQVGRILNGERPLNIDQLIELCRLLRVNPIEVIVEAEGAVAKLGSAGDYALAAKDVDSGTGDVVGEDPDNRRVTQLTSRLTES